MAEVRELVQKAVREYLGREPLNKSEESRAKLLIYRSHPGLLDAVLAEEKSGHPVTSD